MAVPYWCADTSRYPLIVVHLVGADGVQQPDAESLIRIVNGLIERRERVAVVYDLTDSKPDAQRRQLLVTWLRENLDQMSRYVVASAVVAPTAFHRGIIVATFWFVNPKTPVEVFGTRPAAMRWATAQGHRAGLSGLAK
ncbi:MAG: hypothetical protein ACLP1X_25430 [Polyangiaceae bacterium]|jgi:hypothetical protein